MNSPLFGNLLRERNKINKTDNPKHLTAVKVISYIHTYWLSDFV